MTDTRAGDEVVLDELDFRIISLLRKDGRLPYRVVARELGLTEAAVSVRIRRLEETDSLRVVAVADASALGFDLLVSVGVKVEGRPVAEVATALAEIDEVFSITLVLGRFDIELLLLARDQQHLDALLNDRLATLPGVRKLMPSLAMNVLKSQSNWVPFT